jgi:hypothetical protein
MKAIGLVAAHRGASGGSYAAVHRSRILVESMPTGLSMDAGLSQDSDSFRAAAGSLMSTSVQEQRIAPPLPPDEPPLQGSIPALDNTLSSLRNFADTAVDDVALFGSRQAADFARQVEELSRTIDYLQVIAAGLVERVRRQDGAQGPVGRAGIATSDAEDEGNLSLTHRMAGAGRCPGHPSSGAPSRGGGRR